jgi:translocation and assembly module TamA
MPTYENKAKACGMRHRSGEVFFLCCLFAACFARGAYAQTDAVEGIAYTVGLEGVEDPALVETLRAVSDAVSLQERLPATMWLLRRRADGDVDKLMQVLESRGYYEARVNVQILEQERPVHVVFKVALGTPFLLESVEVKPAKDVPLDAIGVFTPEDLGLTLGEPAQARAIIDAGERVLERFREKGWPFPVLANRRVTVDFERKCVDATYFIDPGQKAHFGDTEIAGLDSVKETFVRNRLPWDKGQTYDVRLIRQLRNRLGQTGLFSIISVTTERPVAADGSIPIDVKLAERLHRTVTAGLGYQTDVGVSTRLGWEHRNLNGIGDRIRLDARLGDRLSGIAANYRMPAFRSQRQSLFMELKAEEERVEAYTSRHVSGEAAVERILSEVLTLGAGIAVKSAAVKQQDATQNYNLVSLPFDLNWDTRDDPLNPGKGHHLMAMLAPYAGAGDAGSFLKGKTSYSRYFRLSEKLVLAGRVSAGSIMGADREEVPADERFYAGGSNSVRGFAYKTLSPLDDDDPTGGRSYVDVSFEARRRLTDAIGLVFFVDAGNAFDAVYPAFDEPLRWGTGLGLRIYTPAGPFRLDVAVPVNKRPGVDDAFQIYASFGQAF